MQGNIQGVRVSDTDTRQYLGGLGRHMRIGMHKGYLRLAPDSLMAVWAQKMRTDNRQFMGLGYMTQ